MPTGFIPRIRGFIQRPFTQEMDLANVVLLTMLVVTIGVLWTRILRHITEA